MKRGIAIVSTLIMTAILALMLMALFTATRASLFGGMVHHRKVAALYAAEAGLAVTMAELEANGFTPPSSTLTGTLQGGSWSVTFAGGPGPGALDSVNNLQNTAGSAESYRGPNTVPPASALIIVRAQCGGVERVLEAMVTRGMTGANLTRAIQSTGTVTMIGDAMVDGIKALDDLTPVPGHIQSNSAGPGTVIKWDPQGGAANITGTVSSVATGAAIDLAGYTPGGGVPQTGVGAAAFPVIDIPGEISAKSSSPAPTFNATGVSSLGTGDYYHSGDVTLNGDLDLDGANLYVTGNLTVNGSISGKGSIYVQGETSFQGDASIEGNADSNIALFSKGSVSLKGFNGSQYLAALGATHPQLDIYTKQASAAIKGQQDLVAGYGAQVLAGSYWGPFEKYRRALGQPGSGAASLPPEASPDGGPWNADNFGKMKAYILDPANGIPDSTAKAFIVERIGDLGDMNQMVANIYPDHDTAINTFLATGSTKAIMDAAGDYASADWITWGTVFQSSLVHVQKINYNKLGTAYFQGQIFTNGYLLAENEVTILGAVLAQGDSSLPVTTVGGVTVKPGDLYLGNGTRVTFVEDFFDDGGANFAGTSLSVATWLGR
ncbi:hypothetical protein DYH09_21210 [bacterium CPR1]|nr:hypothetical protein [bacterium CPR1]